MHNELNTLLNFVKDAKKTKCFGMSASKRGVQVREDAFLRLRTDVPVTPFRGTQMTMRMS